MTAMMGAIGLVHLAVGLAVFHVALRFDPAVARAMREVREATGPAADFAVAVAVALAALLWPLIVLDYARRGMRRLWARLRPYSRLRAERASMEPLCSDYAPPKCGFCVDIGRVRVDFHPRYGKLYQPALSGELPGYVDPRPYEP